jgi:hypothetical protein
VYQRFKRFVALWKIVFYIQLDSLILQDVFK